MRPTIRRRLHAAIGSLTAIAVAQGGLVPGSSGVREAAADAPRLERASELEEAAARAYALGKYDFAIQAFKQARATTSGGELLFSIAEAHRQRHALDGKPYDLVQAVGYYRRYLQAAPTGAHHADAERALAALEPKLESAAGDEGALGDAEARESLVTRLSVMSPALGAVVRVDGGPARNAPLFLEVAPGKHSVSVRAPGYREAVRAIVVPRGFVYAAAVALEPQPAKLLLDAPSGASVHVDGKHVGTAPLPKPIDVEPGKHFVSVTKTGFAAYGREVRLERGATTTLPVELEATRQRKVSWVLIGGGGAGIATGIVLGVLAVVQQRRVRDINERADDRGLGDAEVRRREAALATRSNLRVGSGVAAGVGLGLFLVGGALHVLDAPVVPSPPASGRAPTAPRVSAAPVVGPGFAGAAITLPL